MTAPSQATVTRKLPGLSKGEHNFPNATLTSDEGLKFSCLSIAAAIFRTSKSLAHGSAAPAGGAQLVKDPIRHPSLRTRFVLLWVRHVWNSRVNLELDLRPRNSKRNFGRFRQHILGLRLKLCLTFKDRWRPATCGSMILCTLQLPTRPQLRVVGGANESRWEALRWCGLHEASRLSEGQITRRTHTCNAVQGYIDLQSRVIGASCSLITIAFDPKSSKSLQEFVAVPKE